MSRSSKRRKQPDRKQTAPRAAKHSDSLPRIGPRSRSVVKDMALGLVVCVCFFVILEAGLRVGGVGRKDPTHDPFVGFSAVKPLFVVRDGIASTSPARLQYFNAVSFAAIKPQNTVRVFSFGGSTTYGRPFDGRTSFSRWMQDLLSAGDPSRKYEVINAGGISYASYRIVPLIKEALSYSPDLIVVYTGHNEFLERRTYASLFQQGGTLIRVRSFVEDLRLYQVLKRILAFIVPTLEGNGGNTESLSSRGGGTSGSTAKTVLKDEVTAILDRSAGLDLYHRDEELSTAVSGHFSHNIKAMIDLCRNAGVPILFVAPASNVRDFSPFKSEHDKSLTSQAKTDYNAALQRAQRLIKDGRGDKALDILGGLEELDPLFAETHFWKGQALLATGRNEDAKDAFLRARDLDVCPLRCTTALEKKIEQITSREGVPLVQFRARLEEIAVTSGAKTGAPGNESFLDHVHPTIERHQLLAEMIVTGMREKGFFAPERDLTDRERHALYEQGMKSLDRGFFATKDLNLAKVLRWAGKKQESREALRRASGILAGNPEIHKMMGGFLLEEKQYLEAIAEYRKAVDLSGNDPRMEFSLATAYYKAGRKKEALELYEKLFADNPGNEDVSADLATLLLEQGDVRRALEILQESLKNAPGSESLFAPYALALAMSGRPGDGIPWMLRAVVAEPGNPKYFYNLAGMYALSGKEKEALEALNKAVDKGYSRQDSLTADPVFESIRDHPQFLRILERIR